MEKLYNREMNGSLSSNQKKREVEITFEKTFRISLDVEATEEQIEMLEKGENPFWDLADDRIETEGEIEYNYAAYDPEEERDIKEW